MLEKQTKIADLCEMYEQEIQEGKDALQVQMGKIESLCNDYENEIKEKEQVINDLKLEVQSQSQPNKGEG
jgi:hypothetical protein